MPEEEVKSTIAQKLVRIGKKIGYIEKDGENAFHKYAYTSHAAVVRSVYPLLQDEGLAVTQANCTVSHATPDLTSVIVEAGAVVTDTVTGEQAVFRSVGQGSDKGDKATMKAKTAASKYLWQDAFGLAWGDDPEADHTTDERAYGKTTKTTKKATRKPKMAAPKASLPLNVVAQQLNKFKTEAQVRELVDTLTSSDKKWPETDPKGFDKALELCQSKIKELKK